MTEYTVHLPLNDDGDYLTDEIPDPDMAELELYWQSIDIKMEAI